MVNTSRGLSDRSSLGKGFTVKDVAKAAEAHKIRLSDEELGAAVLPRGEGSLACFVWLQNYFGNCGDFEPNKKEIHLDAISKEAVYQDYRSDLILSRDEDPILEYETFVTVWNEDFPHVKIRKYKACSGKCETCALLTELSKKFNSTLPLRHVKDFKALHRSDFMMDRIRYKQRMNRALKAPENFLSIITDGMQQYHTELPYFGNKVGANRKIKQHLQGLTIHGKRARIYRTVDHIRLGANLNIYVLLLALEEELQKNGKLPGTIYIQVDGGPENANYWVLAWMEIIIYLDIGITEIWLCRMRVGHTHADQDARFGIIWLHARNSLLVTPQQYNFTVYDALKSYKSTNDDGEVSIGEGEGAEVIDLFAVPNYSDAVEAHGDMDNKLCRAFKKEHTQLVFRFEKVEKSKKFPLGSKMTYRASALDRFVEFVREGATSPTGWAPRNVFVEWHPEEGMSILKSMPNLSEIQPQPFIEGSVEEMLKSIEVIKSNFLISLSPEAVDDWNKFIKLLPRVGETASMFVERCGMRIPFIEKLLSPSRHMRIEIQATSSDENKMQGSEKDYYAPSVAAGASVRWRECLKPEPPRVSIVDRSDATMNSNKMSTRTKRIKSNRFDMEGITNGENEMYLYSPSRVYSVFRYRSIRTCQYME